MATNPGPGDGHTDDREGERDGQEDDWDWDLMVAELAARLEALDPQAWEPEADAPFAARARRRGSRGSGVGGTTARGGP